MSIDPLLLSRLREGGMSDVLIRHLHDVVEKGSTKMRDAALFAMSDVARGPVRHYTAKEGLTAELALDHGLHWTGRALRLAAPRTLPATVSAVLTGRPLSVLTDFPGSDAHVVTGVETDSSGNIWVAAKASKSDPPPRGRPWTRLRMTLALRLEYERRLGSPMRTTGDHTTLGTAIAFLVMGLTAAVLFMARSVPGGIAVFVSVCVAGMLLYAQPVPTPRTDVRKMHQRDMKALQDEQGW